MRVMEHWDFDLVADGGKAPRPGMACVRQVLDAIPPHGDGRAHGDGRESWRDDVLLVACELLTNACLHTPGATHLDIDLDVDAERLTVAVTDRAASRPVSQPWRPETPHGHGLHIVDRLATDWGVTPAPNGKTVWAALPLDTASPAG
ncbi:ATP-binding protein [Streptomyces aureus]|jgi:hypothetical protein|uniref:ATP-binding protein n=1 Tax=Streptomyces aureus TaxID=193461 RepID=UPI0036A48F66